MAVVCFWLKNHKRYFLRFYFFPSLFLFFSDGLGMFSFSFSRWKFTQITPGCWWTDESPSLLFLFHGLASTQTERNIRNLVAVWPLSLMERSRGKQLSPIWKRWKRSQSLWTCYTVGLNTTHTEVRTESERKRKGTHTRTDRYSTLDWITPTKFNKKTPVETRALWRPVVFASGL